MVKTLKKEKKDRRDSLSVDSLDSDDNASANGQSINKDSKKDSRAGEDFGKQEKSKDGAEEKQEEWRPRQLFVSGIPYTSNQAELMDFFHDEKDYIR